MLTDLERRREVVFEEPELDGRLGVSQYAQHHDAHQSLVQVPRGQREDVELIVWVGRTAAAAECTAGGAQTGQVRSGRVRSGR